MSLHTHLGRETITTSPTHVPNSTARRPEYAQTLGWVGSDVWHAHCVKLDAAGIDLFARTGTGIAHCPGSNMRLASGYCAGPGAARCRRGGVDRSVDGSASNDSGHMLGEARLALLLQRVAHGAVDGGIGNRGSSNGPRCDERARGAGDGHTRRRGACSTAMNIGALAPGMSADIVCACRWTTSAWPERCTIHWPRCFSVMCRRVRHVVVNGRVVVRDAQLTTLELPELIERHNRLAQKTPRDSMTVSILMGSATALRIVGVWW